MAGNYGKLSGESIRELAEICGRVTPLRNLLPGSSRETGRHADSLENNVFRIPV
jgi:hypothetical protein